MAVKTYQRHFGISYEYKDSNTGEIENIPFVANAKLLILFKTITGVEMSKALDDYKNSIGNVVSADNMQAVFKFTNAETPDERLEVLMSSPAQFEELLKAALDVRQYNGVDLITAILISARIAAMRDEDQAEAITLGEEILPEEVYQNPTLAFDILKLAFDYDMYAKKKSYRRQA